jgi:hypothetical protein
MMFLQNQLNQLITPEWYKLDQDFPLAICSEANEFCDQIGWAWWKKQEPNWPQAKLELVDIWHFGIALAIREVLRQDESLASYSDIGYWEKHLAVSGLASKIGNMLPTNIEHLPGHNNHAKLISAMKKIMNHASEPDGAIDFASVKTVMILCGWDMNEIYKTFVGKNCLNIFRQTHGYKNGSYKKMWGPGKEDNVALASIMDWWDGGDVSWIMRELEREYATVV